MAFLTSPLLDRAGVRHAFSLRSGGVSPAPLDSLNLGGSVGDDPANVSENLRRFAAEAGVSAPFATVQQVHGDRVVTARASARGLAWFETPETPLPPCEIEADGVIGLDGAVVGVRTADCVPILLFDPASGAAAAVHAGWRGTAARIVGKAVERLGRDHGARPSELLAAIGPAIGPCCYEVGGDLADRFEALLGGMVVNRAPPAPHLDLLAANRRWLEEAGMLADRIDDLRACTACDAGRFFSHRRDAGRTGRHLSVIASREGRA